MVELQARDPFEGLSFSAPPGVEIAPRRGLALAHVAVRAGRLADLAAAVDARYGITLPVGPRTAAADGLTVVGVGPGAFLFVAEGDEALPVTLAAALEGIANVTEQSDGYAVLRLTGPSVADMMARLVGIDLSSAAFPPGSAAATPGGHVGLTIWREPHADSPYHLAIYLSYLGNLPGMLHNQ